MGSSRWDTGDWKKYSSTARTKTTAEVFTRRKVSDDFDPLKITVRESRDSDENPNSTAIIIAFDETASMGMIPDYFVKEGLGTLIKEIYDRVPVSDPHIMIMGVGDAWYDRAPLQATQFEADIRIAEQLSNIYLEHGGGGNSYESYNLPWYFAARKTSIDCWEKRQIKGYLFTIGDEMPPPTLNASHVKQIFGDTIEKDMKSEDVLAMAARTYNVFHVIAEEGDFATRRRSAVTDSWRELMHQRVLTMSDYTKLSECIVSAIEINEGRDAAKVIDSWSGDTSLVVANAVTAMTAAPAAEGLVRF